MSAKPRIERAALEAFVVDGCRRDHHQDHRGPRWRLRRRDLSPLEEQGRAGGRPVHGLPPPPLDPDRGRGRRGPKRIEAKAEALVKAYCAVADEDWLLFSFHLLQLHHFLPYYQEDGRDPVTLVEDIIKRAMMDMQLPPGDPRVLAAMAIGVITQTAQNKAYGRLGDDALSAHAPLMTAAVKAVLFAR
jgi:hypothetical protein